MLSPISELMKRFEKKEVVNPIKYLISVYLEDVKKIPKTYWQDPVKKKELRKQYPYGKMSARAKELLTLCKGDINMATSCLLDREYFL